MSKARKITRLRRANQELEAYCADLEDRIDRLQRDIDDIEYQSNCRVHEAKEAVARVERAAAHQEELCRAERYRAEMKQRKADEDREWNRLLGRRW